MRCFIRKSTRCASTTSKSPPCKVSSIAASSVRCSSNVTSRANNTPKSMSLDAVAVPSACEPKSHTPNTSGLLANNRLRAGNFRFNVTRKSVVIPFDYSPHKSAHPILRTTQLISLSLYLSITLSCPRPESPQSACSIPCNDTDSHLSPVPHPLFRDADFPPTISRRSSRIPECNSRTAPRRAR